MPDRDPKAASAAPLVLPAYDEAMSLLLEARRFVANVDREVADDLTPADQMVVTREAMRLTTRLSHAMAWLLVQRAVHAGELSRLEAASEPYRLSGQTLCLDDSESDHAAVPEALRDLLVRSHWLYLRVARLDAELGPAAIS